jgi:hypothetical protein
MTYKKIRTKYRVFSLLLIILISAKITIGQNIKINTIEKYNNLSWTEWVRTIESENNLRFFFHPNTIPEFKVQITNDSLSFENQLTLLLSPYSINVSIKESDIFLLKNQKIVSSISSDFYKKEEYNFAKKLTKKDYLSTESELITKIVQIGTKNNNKSSQVRLNGIVRSFNDKSVMPNSIIYIEELGKSLITDKNGEFSVELESGEYIFRIRGVESKEEKYKVNVYSNGNAEFFIDSDLILLDEVVITSEKSHNVRSSNMGIESISAKKTELIPAVMGEKDILKVSLLLPGIQSIGEGAAGINVRGAPADQNMFYLNNIPIYNTAHFMGFFSAINSDALDNMTIYKSNIPSEYGGRLSSVIDMEAKTGNKEKFAMNGGISPITGKLTIEGPIIKEKGSYLLSYRSTYSDWILKRIKNKDLQNTTANFNDAILNLNYDISANNKVNITAYYSSDNINLSNKSVFSYNNKGFSISLKHSFTQSFNSELIFANSSYISSNKSYEDSIFWYKQNFLIHHNELKYKNSLRLNDANSLNFGFNSVYTVLDKGNFEPLNNDYQFPVLNFGESRALETGIYLNYQWNISRSFSITSGVRYNIYNVLGPDSVFNYQPNSSMKIATIIDTSFIGKNSIIKTYTNPDFRLSAKYLINNQNSIKISYNSLHQYEYMLSNTIAISPFYKWQLADYHIKPMSGSQISLGYYTNMSKNKYEFSIESYYKKINNLVQFKDGANIIYNKIIETAILQGAITAYGVEVMLKKKFGRFNGNINYTYSHAQIKVASSILEDNINDGLNYNADYDKPNALNILANYEFIKRLSASANFVYSTGRPITYPTGMYNYYENRFLNYTLRNEYRIPDYIRLDASVKLEGNMKSKKLIHGTWIFSVYNLLGRKNAYSVFFAMENGLVKSYKLSIFAKPIISLTYNFNLGNYANK